MIKENNKMTKIKTVKYLITQKEVEKIIIDSSQLKGICINFNWNMDDKESFVTITIEEVTQEEK
jgi:hypothetical protein